MKAGEILERSRYADASLLGLVDDYFEGAGDGPGGAYGFTQGAPVALISLDNPNNTADAHYGTAGTHANA